MSPSLSDPVAGSLRVLTHCVIIRSPGREERRLRGTARQFTSTSATLRVFTDTQSPKKTAWHHMAQAVHG